MKMRAKPCTGKILVADNRKPNQSCPSSDNTGQGGFRPVDSPIPARPSLIFLAFALLSQDLCGCLQQGGRFCLLVCPQSSPGPLSLLDVKSLGLQSSHLPMANLSLAEGME